MCDGVRFIDLGYGRYVTLKNIDLFEIIERGKFLSCSITTISGKQFYVDENDGDISEVIKYLFKVYRHSKKVKK